MFDVERSMFDVQLFKPSKFCGSIFIAFEAFMDILL